MPTSAVTRKMQKNTNAAVSPLPTSGIHFPAPTSLCSLASLRQLVRLACLAAASLATWAAIGAVAAGDCGVAARAASTKKLRQMALADNARRMANSLKSSDLRANQHSGALPALR